MALLQKIKIDLEHLEDYKMFLVFLEEEISLGNKKAFELYMMALNKEIPKVWEEYLDRYKSLKDSEYKKYLELRDKFKKAE